MSTPDDFLSFFLMGTSGARAFGQGGDLNTDDNLVLEFSAPESQGLYGMDGRNVLALAPFRENLAQYLARDPAQSALRPGERWDRHLATSRLFDRIHGRFLQDPGDLGIEQALRVLRAQAAEFAPLRFLLEQKELIDRSQPRLVDSLDFHERSADGTASTLTISAVRQFMGKERVLVSFVDNARREVYRQRYIDGAYDALEGQTRAYAATTFASLRQAAGRLAAPGGPPPTHAELSAALHGTTQEIVGQSTSP
jgi:spermidine synthase